MEKTAGEPPKIVHLAKGSSAEKSNMAIGDEILELNGRPVCQAPIEIVEKILKEAVRLGEVEVRIRRGKSRT